MLNSKIKKIGGYPSPFVPQEEKTKKEYGLEYFKKMYSEWGGKNTNNQDERRRRYEKIRSIKIY